MKTYLHERIEDFVNALNFKRFIKFEHKFFYHIFMYRECGKVWLQLLIQNVMG